MPECAAAAGTGRVILVGGGPGTDGLITVRGLDRLMAADVVIAGRLAPGGLLARLGPHVRRRPRKTRSNNNCRNLMWTLGMELSYPEGAKRLRIARAGLRAPSPTALRLTEASITAR